MCLILFLFSRFLRRKLSFSNTTIGKKSQVYEDRFVIFIVIFVIAV